MRVVLDIEKTQVLTIAKTLEETKGIKKVTFWYRSPKK